MPTNGFKHFDFQVCHHLHLSVMSVCCLLERWFLLCKRETSMLISLRDMYNEQQQQQQQQHSIHKTICTSHTQNLPSKNKRMKTRNHLPYLTGHRFSIGQSLVFGWCQHDHKRDGAGTQWFDATVPVAIFIYIYIHNYFPI